MVYTPATSIADSGRPTLSYLPYVVAIGGIVASFLVVAFDDRRRNLPYLVLLLGAGCLIAGSYFGIFVAPPEHFMGNVQRIMYVHVPTAWSDMLAMTYAVVFAALFLFTGSWKWDALTEGSIEVGVLLAFLLCCQGAIWAKPTWGVWWDWDPRLTTTAVLLFAFLGILALRRFVDDPMKRAVWSSVATIIAYVDVPIVYFSVKWWNSLHQQQSNLSTVSKDFLIPLLTNGFGMLFFIAFLMSVRARVAAMRLRQEMAAPPDEELGEEGILASEVTV